MAHKKLLTLSESRKGHYSGYAMHFFRGNAAAYHARRDECSNYEKFDSELRGASVHGENSAFMLSQARSFSVSEFCHKLCIKRRLSWQ